LQVPRSLPGPITTTIIIIITTTITAGKRRFSRCFAGMAAFVSLFPDRVSPKAQGVLTFLP